MVWTLAAAMISLASSQVDAHEAAAAAHGLVRFRRLRDRRRSRPRPRQVRASCGPRASFDQPAAHQRVFDAAGAVEIPAIGRAARAAARLVIGHAGPRARIVGLLRLPGDDAALDVDFPATGAGAVHAVGRAHDLVVLPALPVAFLPHAVFVAQFAMAISEGLLAAAKGRSGVPEIGSCRRSFPAYYDRRPLSILPIDP